MLYICIFIYKERANVPNTRSTLTKLRPKCLPKKKKWAKDTKDN